MLKWDPLTDQSKGYSSQMFRKAYIRFVKLNSLLLDNRFQKRSLQFVNFSLKGNCILDYSSTGAKTHRCEKGFGHF